MNVLKTCFISCMAWMNFIANEYINIIFLCVHCNKLSDMNNLLSLRSNS